LRIARGDGRSSLWTRGAATLLAVALLCAAAAAAPRAAGASTGPSGLGGSIQAPSFGEQLDYAADVVRVARAEFDRGVQEMPRGSNNGPAIAVYRAAMVPRARGGAWCAYFVSWVARTAGIPIGTRGAGIAGAAGIRAWAQRTGRWTHRPRPGDVAVYSGHAGIVESVRERG
jgi:hypothetical protein